MNFHLALTLSCLLILSQINLAHLKKSAENKFVKLDWNDVKILRDNWSYLEYDPGSHLLCQTAKKHCSKVSVA